MQKEKGINSAWQKSINRGLLFRSIVTGNATSRIDLTHVSGLTKMAVTKIIAEFIEKKYVIEIGDKATRNNPIGLALSPEAPKIIGVLIQRNYISAVLCDCTLKVLESGIVFMQDYDEETLLKNLFMLTDKLVSHGNILGISIGSIGPLDISRGIILNPPNFHGIRNLAIRKKFEDKYQLPVVFDHNYNWSALAEKHFGSCKDYQNIMYLGLTEGIGLGLVSGGELYSYLTGYPSEIGHISVNFDGPVCLCGNRGCLEVYASTRAVERRVLEAAGKKMTFPEICQNSDTAVIDGILREMMFYLKVGLTSCINLLNPQVVVAGDEGALIPETYLKDLEEGINADILSKNHRHVKIIKPTFCDSYSAVPCAMGILVQVFNGKLLF